MSAEDEDATSVLSIEALVQAIATRPIEVRLHRTSETSFSGVGYLAKVDGTLEEAEFRTDSIDGTLRFSMNDVLLGANNATIPADTTCVFLQYDQKAGIQLQRVGLESHAGRRLILERPGDAPSLSPPAPSLADLEIRVGQQQQGREQRSPTAPPLPALSAPPETALDQLVRAYQPQFNLRLLQASIREGVVLGNIIHGEDWRAHYLDTVHAPDIERYLHFSPNVAYVLLSRLPLGLLHDSDHGQYVSPITLAFASPFMPSRARVTTKANRLLTSVLSDQPDDDRGIALLDEREKDGAARALLSGFLHTMDQEVSRTSLLHKLDYMDESDVRVLMVDNGIGPDGYDGMGDLSHHAVLGMVPRGLVDTWVRAYKENPASAKAALPTRLKTEEQEPIHVNVPFTVFEGGRSGVNDDGEEERDAEVESIDDAVEAAVWADSGAAEETPLQTGSEQEADRIDSFVAESEQAQHAAAEQEVTRLWVTYQLGASYHNKKEIAEAKKLVFEANHIEPSRRDGKTDYYRASQFHNEHFAEWNKTRGTSITVADVLHNPYQQAWHPDGVITSGTVAVQKGTSMSAAWDHLSKAGNSVRTDAKGIKYYRRGDVHDKLGMPGWLDENAPRDGKAQDASAEPPPGLAPTSDAASQRELAPQQASHLEEVIARASPAAPAARPLEAVVAIEEGPVSSPPGAITTRTRTPEGQAAASFGRNLMTQPIAHDTEDSHGAIDHVVHAYRSEYSRRLMVELIETGAIDGTNVRIGTGSVPYGSALSIDRIAALLEKSPRSVTRKIDDLPKDVVRHEQTTRTLCPLAALVLYQPIQDRKPEDMCTLDEASEHLLFTAKDTGIQDYLRTAGIVSHDSMLYRHFCAVYNGLANAWMKTVSDSLDLQTLLASLGFVSRKEYDKMQPNEQDAYDTARLVLGRIGRKEDTPAPVKTPSQAAAVPTLELMVDPAPPVEQNPPATSEPRYRAKAPQYVLPRAVPGSVGVNVLVKVYRDQYVQRFVAGLANRGVLQGKSVSIGDSSFPVDEPIELNDLASVLHRTRQSLERRVQALPPDAVERRDEAVFLNPITALGLYHPFDNLGPNAPFPLSDGIKALLLDPAVDGALLDFAKASGIHNGHSMLSSTLLDIYHGVTNHLAATMASPSERLGVLRDIGHITWKEYGTEIKRLQQEGEPSPTEPAEQRAPIIPFAPPVALFDMLGRRVEPLAQPASVDGLVDTLIEDAHSPRPSPSSVASTPRYTLQFGGEGFDVACGKAARAYQDTFNVRYAAARLADGTFKTYGIKVGQKFITYTKTMTLAQLAESTEIPLSRVHRLTKELPKQLYGIQDGVVQFSPFAGLAIVAMEPIAGEITVSHIEQHLLMDHTADGVLISYLTEASIVAVDDRGLRMDHHGFSSLQSILMASMAKAMGGKESRMKILRELGYIDREIAAGYLMQHDVPKEKIGHALKQDLFSAVLMDSVKQSALEAYVADLVR